jgi:hypothetical protein
MFTAEHCLTHRKKIFANEPAQQNSQLPQVITRVTCIQEVLCSNLAWSPVLFFSAAIPGLLSLSDAKQPEELVQDH